MNLDSHNLAHFWAAKHAPLALKQHFYQPSIDVIVNENAGIFRPVEGTRDHDKVRVIEYVRSRVCSGAQNPVLYVMRQAELSHEMYGETRDILALPAKFAMMRRWAKRIEEERKRRNG